MSGVARLGIFFLAFVVCACSKPIDSASDGPRAELLNRTYSVAESCPICPWTELLPIVSDIFVNARHSAQYRGVFAPHEVTVSIGTESRYDRNAWICHSVKVSPGEILLDIEGVGGSRIYGGGSWPVSWHDLFHMEFGTYRLVIRYRFMTDLYDLTVTADNVDLVPIKTNFTSLSCGWPVCP